MIHGHDVARAILAVHAHPTRATGERWILTDNRVYDWWDLASAWGNARSTPPKPGGRHAAKVAAAAAATATTTAATTATTATTTTTTTGDKETGAEDGPRGPQPRWVQELMREHGVRALPRSPETIGRAFDAREFWETFGLQPERARLDLA
jgi:hypothetical protein